IVHQADGRGGFALTAKDLFLYFDPWTVKSAVPLSNKGCPGLGSLETRMISLLVMAYISIDSLISESDIATVMPSSISKVSCSVITSNRPSMSKRVPDQPGGR